MACNCGGGLQKLQANAKPTACPRCGTFKTTKPGAIVCPNCKHIFFVRAKKS